MNSVVPATIATTLSREPRCAQSDGPVWSVAWVAKNRYLMETDRARMLLQLKVALDPASVITQDVEEYLASLDRQRPPSAYLFRCRHCDVHLAYSDFT